MRRKVFAIAALLALVACGVAYATGSSPDTYTASLKAPANGSAKKPAVTSLSQAFGIKNATSGDFAYPATNVFVKIADLKVENANSYPKCSSAQIDNSGNAGNWNAVCPSASEIASGSANATLYPPELTGDKGSAQPCVVGIHTYNDGPGKLTFFLTVSGNQCYGGVLHTGDASPWTATYKEVGTTEEINIPLPPDVSTNAGNIDLWAAINSETLNWKKLDTHNKPVIVSTGCQSGKRAYTYTFTVTKDGSTKETGSVSGKSSC